MVTGRTWYQLIGGADLRAAAFSMDVYGEDATIDLANRLEEYGRRS